MEMRAKDADTWLSALRSGKYAQGSGTLCHRNEYGELTYCCLGVQQAVLGKVQEGKELPTLRWLQDHNIKIKVHDSYGEVSNGKLNYGRKSLVDIVLDPPVKNAGNEYDSIGELNDSGKFSFKQIAKILDKRIKRI